MKKFIEWAMAKAKHFSVFDWAVFKVLLFSLGAMIGAYFSKFFKKLAPLMWIIIILGYAYMIYTMLFVKSKKKITIFGHTF